MEAKYHLLNNEWVSNEIKEKIKNITLKQMNCVPTSMGHNENNLKREIHSNVGLCQDRKKKPQINNLIFYLNKL